MRVQAKLTLSFNPVLDSGAWSGQRCLGESHVDVDTHAGDHSHEARGEVERDVQTTTAGCEGCQDTQTGCQRYLPRSRDQGRGMEKIKNLYFLLFISIFIYLFLICVLVLILPWKSLNRLCTGLSHCKINS